MATKETPIEFTVGDQERLVTIEGSITAIAPALEAMNKTMAQVVLDVASKIDKLENNLPCRQKPPQCTQEGRIESLEGSRRKWYTAMITVVIGSLLSLMTWLWTIIKINPTDGM